MEIIHKTSKQKVTPNSLELLISLNCIETGKQQAKTAKAGGGGGPEDNDPGETRGRLWQLGCNGREHCTWNGRSQFI